MEHAIELLEQYGDGVEVANLLSYALLTTVLMTSRVGQEAAVIRHAADQLNKTAREMEGGNPEMAAAAERMRAIKAASGVPS